MVAIHVRMFASAKHVVRRSISATGAARRNENAVPKKLPSLAWTRCHFKLSWYSILAATLWAVGSAEAGTAIILEQWSPKLYAIYQTYPQFHTKLAEYARKQGFRQPIEEMATVLHEIIHIDSFVHNGFFVDGTYYEPYVSQGAWPALTNEQLAPHVLPHERGIVYDAYVRRTPKNHFGNIIDEINAYGHVLPFVCEREPTSTGKQVRNLIEFLRLAEVYLRTLRVLMPIEYQRLTVRAEARGALVLIIERAWAALRQCGIADAAIPADEAREFIANVRLTSATILLQKP